MPGGKRGQLVAAALLVARGGGLQLALAALDQLADRRDAQLAFAQRVARRLELVARVFGRAVLLLDGLRQPVHEALVAAHDIDAAALRELARPALFVVAPVLQQLLELGLRAARRVAAAAQRAERGVARLFGLLQQHEQGGDALGAAAFVLAQARPAPSAVVLESMFPSINEAVTNRLGLYLGAPGTVLAPLLLWQLPLRVSISPSQLQPISEMATMHSPLLIAAGMADQHTPVAETQRIFDAAAAPKDLWLLPGAAHVDLHAFAPREYEARIATFLARHLHAQAPI